MYNRLKCHKLNSLLNAVEFNSGVDNIDGCTKNTDYLLSLISTLLALERV